MTTIIVKEADMKEAAAKGYDEFLEVFFDAIYKPFNDTITSEMFVNLNYDQVTLAGYKILRDEVMDGGFVQLICNGYGKFFFFNPFAKVLREWGLDDLAAVINKAGRLFRKYGREIKRDCTDEEFMEMFEQYPEFDELDDKFVENEEEWTAGIAEYVDSHIGRFAQIER